MRRSIFNNHNLENQLTPEDSEEQDKMEEITIMVKVPSSYVDDFKEEVKDLEKHYQKQLQ